MTDFVTVVATQCTSRIRVLRLDFNRGFLRPDEAFNGVFGMRFVEEVQQIAGDETCGSKAERQYLPTESGLHKDLHFVISEAAISEEMRIDR